MFKLDFDQSRLKALIAKRVAEKVAQAGTEIYKSIIGGKRGIDFPFWSGAYISSWQYNYGSIDTTYSPLPTNKSGRPNVSYPRPRPQPILPNYNSPFAVLYISNNAPHAGKVEYDGTPKHPSPWMVAHHAYNTYRVRINP